MKVLVTGSKGFIGKNLCEALKNIRDGKDRTHKEILIDEIFECDLDTTEQQLDEFCLKADFVFNFAGVNRPNDNSEFYSGNTEFCIKLCEKLQSHNNTCPVMYSSSIQATCIGRYDGDYGRSKKAAEDFLFDYANKTGVKVLVYRFPNLFGKWCRPNYNSVIATFCHNIANDKPIIINDEKTVLELVYIDDLVDEMLLALQGKETRKNEFCCVPISHITTLGEVVRLLERFNKTPKCLIIPEIKAGTFEKKLYSTFLSYLPNEKVAFPIKMNVDTRGSFTELLKTENHGQISVNISNPGITKGQHWHNSKWEIFIVVSGHGLIQLRKIGSDEILEFEVSGDKIEAVQMLPGYTHNIINLSQTDKLITVMWANEQFDAEHPDTFFEEV